jgi:hypothetical protein
MQSDRRASGSSNKVPFTFLELPQDQKILPARRFHRPGRAILTEDQAREIFLSKPNDSFIPNINKSCAALLAKNFGVTIKTVRDVWIGRTWYRSTYDLDPSRPVSHERLHKQPGRPKGAKDTKPRIKRAQTQAEYSTDYSAEGNIWSLISSSEQTSIVAREAMDEPSHSHTHFDANSSCLSLQTVQSFQDPFHDDWPFWARRSVSYHGIDAGRFSQELAMP